MMSSSEKIKDSPNADDSSDDVFQNQDEEFDRISTNTAEENLPPLEEFASEYQRLPSRSVKVSSQLSNQPPTPSSQARNIDQLKVSTDIDPSQELRNHTSRSTVDAVISSQQNPTTASVSVFHNSDASGAKITQRNLSPFAVSRNAEFESPPERGTAPANRSLSKNLKEINTPSPEKRSVETDVGSTPIKRLRKTPDSDLGETGSCRSELSLPAAAKTSYGSPTYLQIQQMEAAFQKKEKSESLNTPSSKKKRKTARNCSVESKTASDHCLSNVKSPSSSANILHESPTNSSIVAIRNVDKSSSERKALISPRDCLTYSSSPAKYFSPDDLLQTASVPILLTEGYEFGVSNESTDASTANPNLMTRKQKGAKSVSDASDEEALPNFTPKKPDIIKHPASAADTSLLRSNNVSGKQWGRLPYSDVSSEVVLPDLPVQENESAVHRLGLSDKTSSSNLGPSLEFQNSATEVFEAHDEVQNSASVSVKETESGNETRIFKSSHPCSLILNTELTPCCHLPRRSDISATDVHRRVLDFVKSDQMRIDQNRSNSSTRTSSPVKESGPQTNEFSVPRSRGIHQRSLSDKTITSKSIILEGKFTRSHSKESSTPSILGMHRRSLSDRTLTSRNSTDVQEQHDQSKFHVISRSRETPISRSLPEISEGVNVMACAVQPLSRGKPPISTSNATSATSDPLEFSHSGRSLPSNKSSTSRNDPKVQTQRDGNDTLLQRRSAKFLSGEASTSRNQPEVLRDITPYIDVSEGQASTPRHQPIITGGSSLDQSCILASINEFNSSHKALEGETSTVNQESSITDGSSTNDQLVFSDNPTSSDVSLSGENADSTFEPHTPPHANQHPEYVVGARQLLQSVLKELMLYEREDTQWNLFEACFSRVSESHSRSDRIGLIEELLQYSRRKERDVWTKVLLLDFVMTELHILVFCGRFILIVVKTLIYALGVSCSRCWYYRSTLNPYHEQFKSLCNVFSSSSETINVEDIQDGATRNRMKTWKEMIRRLLLVTLMAFRLLLINVGENIPKIIIEPFESGPLGEDKMCLRRHE